MKKNIKGTLPKKQLIQTPADPFDELFKANFDLLDEVEAISKEIRKDPEPVVLYESKPAVTKHPKLDYWNKHSHWFSIFSGYLERHFPGWPANKYSELLTKENFSQCVQERKENLLQRLRTKDEKVASLKIKPVKIEQPIENNNDLPDGLFKMLAVEKFIIYEKSMMETGIYLDGSKKWIGTVDGLAAFIWALKDKNYFMGNNFNKILPKERDFFKTRYKFHKQLEQKTRPSAKVKLQIKMFTTTMQDI